MVLKCKRIIKFWTY